MEAELGVRNNPTLIHLIVHDCIAFAMHYFHLEFQTATGLSSQNRDFERFLVVLCGLLWFDQGWHRSCDGGGMSQMIYPARQKLETVCCKAHTGLMSRKCSYAAWLWVAVLAFGSAVAAHAQLPTLLTDKIYQGSGSIDLLKDISAANLQSMLANNNGGLFLGVDVNENEAGNESRDSLGIAIKQLQLVVTTTAGTFTFGDFLTSTTAMIREAGSSTAQQFYTLFGKSGSSQITGGSAGLGSLDDVIRVQNVSFQGTILSAKLNVNFLGTAKTTVQGNETFFDYSGGFEDFALLGKTDAALLEAANFGVAGASSTIAYSQTAPAITLSEAGLSTPGAPVPPLGLLVAMGAIVAWKTRRNGKT